ncbi:unnamed protein product [Urochloa decumbens]|uniref:FRIGIDA-like protein n=1 Tax=Urochloa decumbens TaxID=240449 RepID=A0ABC8YIV4_9POAL
MPPPPPMPQPGPDRDPPAEMTAEELEAAVVALPGKRDALREAFDRLAACSPSPLPFAWADIDAHVSSLQSSISLRVRQKADEEMLEGDGDETDKISKDGKDEEAIDEVLQEEEVAEVADNRISNDMKDDKEAIGEEQAADEEMQMNSEEMQSTEDAEKASLEKEDANMDEEQSTEDAKNASRDKEDANMEEEEQSTEDAKNASRDKEDASMEDEQDTDIGEVVTKKASATKGKEDEACGEEKEEHESHEEEAAKNVAKEEAAVANEASQEQGIQALPGGFNDHSAACANMDAKSLVKFLFTTRLNLELHAALHHAPDAAALALDIVELFLHDKMLKTNTAWVNCVGLIRMVPVVVTELSADTIEQAKQVAKDWKEIIDSPECCTVLGILASWGLLYFLISYNIASEFETKEIFRLFATMPRKQQKMNYAMLFKDLRLTDKIPELMDYLIENGQQMDVLYWARVFNLVDKYPPVSLLQGYVEKAKQTASMTHQSLSAVIMELDNLRRAQVLAEKQITDSSLSASIRAEISDLLEEFGKRKKSLAKSYTSSTSNSQQENQSNKKHKKDQDHKGQESQQQGKQSKLGEKLDKKLDKPQEKQQQKQEDKPQEKQQQSNQQHVKQKQQQSKQQHAKRPRQHTPKLSAWASPTPQNAPLRDHFGHPPYAAIHGVYHGYPPQPGWPGAPCVPPFAPQLGAPEYIMPFNPFNPHPEFYPW